MLLGTLGVSRFMTGISSLTSDILVLTDEVVRLATSCRSHPTTAEQNMFFISTLNKNLC